MEAKSVHIVFRVLNFLTGSNSDSFNLLPIEKLLLLCLAKHHGVKGIYPAIPTIAKELKITVRYVSDLVAHLELLDLIFVERKIGRSNRYTLTFLSTDHCTTVQGSPLQTPEPQFRVPLNHSSGYPCTTVQGNKTNNQNRKKKTERARTSRAHPLSPSFEPNAEGQNLAMEVSKKANISPADLLRKFRNLALSKEKISVNWNAEWEIFLINERPRGAAENVIPMRTPCINDPQIVNDPQIMIHESPTSKPYTGYNDPVRVNELIEETFKNMGRTRKKPNGSANSGNAGEAP